MSIDIIKKRTMKIIDIELSEINAASNRGRVRSAETQKLINVISDLDRKTAKAVIIEKGVSAAKIRSRLAYAAKLAGRRLRISVREDRVMFAISPRKRQRRAGKQ